MITRKILLLAGAALLGSAAAAQAEVRVSFVHPENYTDAGTSPRKGAKPGAGVLKELDTYLQRIGARSLKPGQRLDIEITDIDLAGDFRPWNRRLDNVRILDGLSPPVIRLRYRLTERGRVIARGEERVSDLNYQMRFVVGSGRLDYEKAMLRDWFRKRIVQMRPPRGAA
ncbi:DUF3016 domain-containing protein [Terrihabitans sp. B22-R8]|uniref:DUF3016 domain-containing protein n=1 Tax=Terrihabitans sp. B22-R8 TaxID=3425128 RepID=UPI00403C2CA8